tara:strand:+ start:327 stop:560 length:234 start_codon:yes stop_codon:yes gene_type:complete
MTEDVDKNEQRLLVNHRAMKNDGLIRLRNTCKVPNKRQISKVVVTKGLPRLPAGLSLHQGHAERALGLDDEKFGAGL